jgi:hypothetical protein
MLFAFHGCQQAKLTGKQAGQRRKQEQRQGKKEPPVRKVEFANGGRRKLGLAIAIGYACASLGCLHHARHPQIFSAHRAG